MPTDTLHPALGSMPSSGRSTFPIWRSLVVAGLLGLTVLACFERSEVNQTSEAGVVMQLPDRVGDFTGVTQEISEAERVILPKDTELVRKLYTDPAGDQITQSIVLSGGEKRSIHRPEICLPGQGWTISGQQKIPITLRSGRRMDVVNLWLTREIVAPSGDRRVIRGYFMYWFVGKDRTTASQIDRMVSTAWDRITKNTNHRWAYVIVSGLIPDSVRLDGKNAEQTLNMAEQFVRDSVPAFQKSEIAAASAGNS